MYYGATNASSRCPAGNILLWRNGLGQGWVGGACMRRAFLSKRVGDFAASVGFRRSRGYISSASRRAPTSTENLPTLFESRGGNRNACRGHHRAR